MKESTDTRRACWYNKAIWGNSLHKKERYCICGVLSEQNFQTLQREWKVYIDGKQTKDS